MQALRADVFKYTSIKVLDIQLNCSTLTRLNQKKKKYIFEKSYNFF
jgi:hypothetical protein